MAVSRAQLDRWTLAYVGVASAFLTLRWTRLEGGHATLVALHVVAASAALLAPHLRLGGASGRFLGDFYPLLLLYPLYAELGALNAVAPTFHDARVQAWEEALFGGQPAREWIRAQPWPWLSNLLHAAYLSYYLILAAAPLGLWLSGRAEGARRTVTAMMVCFYVCYAIFLLFPVTGPRYLFSLAQNAATATPLAAFTQDLLNAASSRGTAFPSSHVAAALVASLTALREWRPLGAVLLPAAILLALGTVYGQLHYVVDALAGAALAAVVVALGGDAARGSAALTGSLPR
jgi:membrane-associated phospholipid phosphatase